MNGVLLIHKEAGMTSHDVVARLRRILHMKKIGHSGTLDPQATGVLLVMVGNACKVLPYLQDTDKEYIATMALGKRTSSDDVWGEVLECANINPIDDLQGVLNTFLGKQKQVPPMVSSVRVNGKKLYEYARHEEDVQRPLRDVVFHELEVLDAASMKFRIACSAGTYIRSLCRDIGTKTGNLGYMTSLIRTRVGRFSLQDCVTLQEVEQGDFQLHPIRELLDHYPMISYSPVADIYHGKHVHMRCEDDEVAVLDGEDVIAIYRRDHGDVFRSIRGLW